MPIDENVKENIKDLRFNQHKTIREIAEITGKSSRDIIAVLNESEDKEIMNNEVKRFVKEYLDFHKGKLDLINEEEELYRIFLPKHIEHPFRDTRIFEGTFNGEIAIRKNYHYLALGNPHVMSLIHNAAMPTVGILNTLRKTAY